MKHIAFYICAIALLGFTACNAETKSAKTIMLRSEGQVEVVPNMATINIYLSCTNKNIEKAKSNLVSKSNALDKQFKGFGIEQKDVQTTAVSLQKTYNWENGRQVFEGYQCSMNYMVTVRDMKLLAEVYSELLTNESLTINGLQYSHSQMDSLKNEAYLNALNNANILADRLLERLPESSKEVLQIGNVKLSSSAATMSYADAEEMMVSNARAYKAAGVAAINSGVITIDAVLYIEYLIK